MTAPRECRACPGLPAWGTQGQDGAAERGGRPARATKPAGNVPRPPSRGPEKIYIRVVNDGIRNIKIMVCCTKQPSGPRLHGDPGGSVQPSTRGVDSEQQQPRWGVGLLHQRGGPTPYPHGFGGQSFHAVFQDQKKLCPGDAL